VTAKGKISAVLRWRPVALAAALTFSAVASPAAPSMQVVYAFAASGDPGFTNGSGPEAGVLIGPGGNLWGTTYSGGNVSCGGYNCGALYWSSPAPGSQIHLIHSFKANAQNAQDGYFPTSNVVSNGTVIVGTTKYGGGLACTQNAQPRCGVIFTSNLFDDKAYSIVHRFSGGSDGGLPNNIMYSRKDNAFYGTTSAGGGFSGAGTVFKLALQNNSWQFQTIYSFQGAQDGGVPTSAVIQDASGNLYGTTSEGGNRGACAANGSYNIFGGCGTVFKLAPPSKSGGKWTETVLYTFSSYSDGSKPNEPLVIDSSGNLFGTTLYGGSTAAACVASGDPFLNGCGTVFELFPVSGGKSWRQTTLYRFQGSVAGLTFDGQYPRNLVIGTNGNLYGATSIGGAGSLGTLFEMTRYGIGGYAYSKLYDFCASFFNCPTGGLPNDGLAIDSANNVYGTTVEGGAGGSGVIFRFNTAGR